MIDVSCGFPPSPRVAEYARCAEDLGYRRVWLYDSPVFYSDVWVGLAQCVERTERIGLGTAVLVPSLRHVVTQASAIATIDGLAPGRLAVAIGTGFTGRLALGKPPLAWTGVAEYVRQLRALLGGEETEVDGAVVRLLAPPGFLPDRPVAVPILVAANGPKGLKVAHELGDGVMTVGDTPPGFDWCSVLVFGTVLDDGEPLDSARVVDAAGPAAAVVYHALFESDPDSLASLPGGEAWRASIEALPERVRHLAVHEDHLVRLTDRDRGVLDPAMLPLLTWTGSAGDLRARLDALDAAGGTEILFAPAGPDIERELRAFHAMATR